MTPDSTELFSVKKEATDLNLPKFTQNSKKLVCRNLFGTPEKGAIESERRLEEQILTENFFNKYTDLKEKQVFLKSKCNNMQEQKKYETKFELFKTSDKIEFHEKSNSESKEFGEQNSEKTPKSFKNTNSIENNAGKKSSERAYNASAHNPKLITQCFLLRKRPNTDADFNGKKHCRISGEKSLPFNLECSNASSVEKLVVNEAEQHKNT